MSTRERPKVLVTGASGRVGGQVCRQLELAGASVRAATRRPGALPSSRTVETRAVDLAEPATLTPALEGVDAVFLMWPFFDSAQEARRKVAPVAARLGAHARRVVCLSSQGVENDRHTFWAVVEDAVAGHVREWTVLRPTGFAANARQWAPQIRRDGVVRWPFGRLARPLIHEADIAAVAVEALLHDGHQGRHYVISGPERVTQRAQVDIIGAAIGRPLRWEELDRARAGSEYGIPDLMLDAWEGFTARPEPVTDEVRRLTGRPALSFADWARDNAGLFR
ncbi:SDR family oxidoreductase [Streptomyces sp. NPDC050560]|uniref:SDR family oxidoreductase n=1 Tax=Streptomyces sp. NPDC050560 TaxID=3365630 RepID=UPI003789DB1A